MRRSLILSIYLLSSLAFGTPPKAGLCEGCHGSNNKPTVNSATPKLFGQNKLYLINQLQYFKSGERKSPMMTGVAKGLSEEEIIALSEYFSKMGCK